MKISDPWLISHSIIYLITIFSIIFYIINFNQITLTSTFLSILLGWAFYGLSSVGHDLIHMGYYNLAFCIFDIWLISSETWIIMHHIIHHQSPFTEKDTMFLRGDNIFSELYYLYIGSLINKKINNNKKNSNKKRLKVAPWWKILLRLPFYFFCIKFIKWWYLLIIILSFRFFYGYFGFIGHCHAKLNHIDENNRIDRQISTTVDILPDSWLCSLITGGLNAHLVHHLNPTISRSQANKESIKNKKYYGKNYRIINTWKDLWIFWKTR
tara:strand:- start:1192 stop:1995 length:804 start_codon:yes stop_codon:yes gene_type:complete